MFLTESLPELEYYKTNKKIEIPKKSYSITPPKLYQQKKDWTCAVACIRSILSAFNIFMPEDDIVSEYSLNPHPLFSKDIKKLNIFEDNDVIYGCNISNEKIDINYLINLLYDDYYIMIETMFSYSHWMILLGYYNFGEIKTLIFYDPYYNELKKFNLEEFYVMWKDGNYNKNKIIKDFIAVKKGV